ncbi:acyltransferase family protein [Serinibacter arcticus]|uniref:acyltransferase family protein n=1 Tax=Serinibacter arcticus TaxID=1655435 RepID=UPI001304EE97|nr:acyltransferase family protein [Serinibacter arcticus]
MPSARPLTSPAPSSAPEPATDRATTPGERVYRHDVEGLRAVAILLVAGYHVWGGGRVSGGVDVFLLISGFFVGGGLLRRFSQGRGLQPGPYLARLARRLYPPLVLTLLAVVVGTLTLLPQSEWSGVSGGVLASLTYTENWRMALEGQAYAAADQMASPVQHIWSLSVQGQLFVVLPLLMLGAATLLRRLGADEARRRRVLVRGVAVIAVASFVYALVGVRVAQDVAYFDTFARAWEYLVGALLAVVLARVSLPRVAAVALGVVGLGMILATGVVVDARATFPGPETLLPILGAAAFITAGASGIHGAGRLLAWRPVAVAGGYAYEFYLWHWVVLVFALAATGREHLGWLAGSVVLIASGVIAVASRWVTTRLVPSSPSTRTTSTAPVEAPATVAADDADAVAPSAPRRPWARTVTAATVLVLTVGTPVGWLSHRAANPWTGITDLDLQANPGALTLLDPGRWPTDPDAELVPGPLEAAGDWPLEGRENCEQTNQVDTDVKVCVLGDPDAQRSVALIGGSHSANFALALDAVAREASTRVDAYIKQGCPLLLREHQPSDDRSDASCTDWNVAVMEQVVQSGTVGVVTTGTRPGFEREDVDGDYVPADYVRAWEHLMSSGVPVIAIRDTPWFRDDARACVERNGADSDQCRGDRATMLGGDVLTDAVEDDLFTAVDLSDAFCDEGQCHAVVGNVMVYIDSNHITATYQRTLAPALAAALGPVSWW